MKNTDPILMRIKDIKRANPLCDDDFSYSPSPRALYEYIKFDYELDNYASKLLASAVKELNLTITQIEKIERICLGIMKLDKSKIAKAEHIAEAIQYVCYDKE